MLSSVPPPRLAGLPAAPPAELRRVIRARRAVALARAGRAFATEAFATWPGPVVPLQANGSAVSDLSQE